MHNCLIWLYNSLQIAISTKMLFVTAMYFAIMKKSMNRLAEDYKTT